MHDASSFVLALPLNGSKGTTFTDLSCRLLKGSGSAKTIDSNWKYANKHHTKSSIMEVVTYFDGNGDYLTIPA